MGAERHLKRPSPEPGQELGLFGVVLRHGQSMKLLQQLQDVRAGRIDGDAARGFVEAHNSAGALINKGLWAVAEALVRVVAQPGEGFQQDDRVHAARVAARWPLPARRRLGRHRTFSGLDRSKRLVAPYKCNMMPL